MSGGEAPVIVGSRDDQHVQAVAAACRACGQDPVIFDAPRLATDPFELNADRLVIAAQRVVLGSGFGWLRRYAPHGWVFGDRVGALEFTVKRAFRGLLAGIVRSSASAPGVGCSGQDWADDGNKCVFLDLNPGGQWLFLPEPIGSQVAASIGRYLTTGERT